MDRKKNRFVVVLLLLLMVLPSRGAEQTEVPVGRKVRMGIFESIGMFDGAAEGERKSGYCYDFMMQIANYTGWDYEFCYGSFAQLYEKLKRGEIDVLPYTNFNEQRGREVLFSDVPLAEEEYYLAVRDSALAAGGNEALNGCVISTMMNADYNSLLFDYIKRNGLDVKVEYYHYVDEIWDALRNGKADATIYTSNSYSKDDWVCVGTFGKKPTYICVAKDKPELMAQLNEAVERIDTESPAFRETIYAKYFSDNPWRKRLTAIEQEWVEQHPVLHVGAFTNDAPYIFSVDETTGAATGLSVDVTNAIIERLDLDMTADFRCFRTLDEMTAALDSGLVDVIIPFYPNYYVAQQHNLIISNTVRVSNMELVYKKGTKSDDMYKTIATPDTRLGIYYVQEFYPESEIMGVSSVQEAVDKVLAGEAKGAIAQNVVLHYIKERYSNLNYLVLPEGCGTCFAARPENYPLIRVLNRGLNYFTHAEILSMASKYTLERKVSVREFLASHNEVVILLVVILLTLLALTVASLQLNHMKKKADELNKSKTRFLFNMSHDIRTPMNAILGYTDIALRHYDDEPRAKDSLQKIKSSGSHLLGLINDILEMSRIESGTFDLAENGLDIRELIARVDAMGQALAIPKNIHFETVIGELKSPYVHADEVHYSEVLINLLSNAMKYTGEGGKVSYRVSEIGDVTDGAVTYRFEVEDNGIGMSEEFQKHLFEAFTREQSSTVSKQEGAGLGLSIVKRIVDQAGGRVDVRSKQGVGTTMSVEIPLRVMSAQEIDAFRRQNQPEEEAKGDVTLKGKKILLVEDNEMNREIATTILEEFGCIITPAEDGDIAVEKIRSANVGDYDLVLMDVQMPTLDGYEATRQIRALGTEIADIPIVAMTANAFEEDRKAALDAGMDDHIGKPIDVDVLTTTLAKFL